MKKTKLILLLIILTLLIGCSKNSNLNLDRKYVDVIISQNFGNKMIDKKTIEFEGDLTVMEIMLDNFEIETAYGGGFINAIGNVESGFTNKVEKSKSDWFYYVNGRSAEVGADDYYLLEGDQIIWDYHNWENGSGLNSIIGAYPRNFGLVTTEILYSDEFLEESEKLSEYLGNCSIKALNEESLQNTEVNSIVIAKNSELIKSEYIEKFYENAKKIGIYYEIDNSIKVFDYKRKVVKDYGKGAVVVSIVKSYGKDSVLWLITGNDENNIREVVDLLTERPEEIEGAFSILVTNDEVIKLPIEVISED
jgi:hypothetical protein